MATNVSVNEKQETGESAPSAPTQQELRQTKQQEAIKILDRHRPDLIQCINMKDHLCAHMRSRGLINMTQEERIRSCCTEKDKVETLLDDIIMKGLPERYNIFRQCLVEDGQNHIVDHYLPQISAPTERSTQCVTTLKSTIKEHYLSELKQIQLLPWDEDKIDLDGVFTRLSINKETHKGVSTVAEEDLQHYTDMFEPLENGKLPTRIRVEGDAGTGKTTLGKKLAVDWADEESNTKVLQQFELVFLLCLNEITSGMKIENAIIDQILPDDTNLTPQQLRTLIEESKEKVMVLFDGFDEYNNSSEDINKIIDNKLLRKMTVVVTTRPTRRPQGHCDKTCRIKGFTNEDQLQYIKKLISVGGESTLKIEKLTEKIKKDIPRELTSTPLVLAFLCILVDQLESLPDRLTDVYDKLVKFLYQRHEAKTKKKLQIEALTLLAGIGKIAWISLKCDQLVFIMPTQTNLRHVAELALAIGILSPHRHRGKLKREPQYIFTHKTLQEFSAALYLVKQAETMGDCKELRECCATWDKIQLYSYVIRFFIGLSTSPNVLRDILCHIDTTSRNYLKELMPTWRCGVEHYQLVWSFNMFLISDIPVSQVNCIEDSMLTRCVHYSNYMYMLGTTDRLFQPEILVCAHDDTKPAINSERITSLMLTFCKFTDSSQSAIHHLLDIPNLNHLCLSHIGVEEMQSSSVSGSSEEEKPDDIKFRCKCSPNLRSFAIHYCGGFSTRLTIATHLLQHLRASVDSIETLCLWATGIPKGALADCLSLCNPSSRLQTLCYNSIHMSDTRSVLHWALSCSTPRLRTLVLGPCHLEVIQLLLSFPRLQDQPIRHLTLMRIDADNRTQKALFRWIHTLTSLNRLSLSWASSCDSFRQILEEHPLPKGIQHLSIWQDRLKPGHVEALSGAVLGLHGLLTLGIASSPLNVTSPETYPITTNLVNQIGARRAPNPNITLDYKFHLFNTLAERKPLHSAQFQFTDEMQDVNHIVAKAAMAPIFQDPCSTTTN